jgi:hypothetical protein
VLEIPGASLVRFFRIGIETTFAEKIAIFACFKAFTLPFGDALP